MLLKNQLKICCSNHICFKEIIKERNNMKHDGCVGCIHEKEITSKDCKKCKYNYKDMYQLEKEIVKKREK